METLGWQLMWCCRRDVVFEGSDEPGSTRSLRGQMNQAPQDWGHGSSCSLSLSWVTLTLFLLASRNRALSALGPDRTLKRKDKEYEHEVERLTREKIASQQRLAQLKKELGPSMGATEMERVLRQTVQPEDDQVSTSTASDKTSRLKGSPGKMADKKGEEDLDQDFEDEDMPAPLPSEPPPIAPPPIVQAHALLTLQPAPLPLSGVLTTPPMGGVPVQSQAPPPQAIAPYPPQPSAAQAQPSVIAHAAVSHPSVIQAVHHKHLTPIAPSPGPAPAAPQPPAGAAQRVTVTHLGPALYPQALTVSQHITHTFTHHHHPHHHAMAPAHATPNGLHVNGGQTAVLASHPQLGGQTTLLNPVTLVKLA
ncbi:unnamed protein product [Arctogadus glacialis]